MSCINLDSQGNDVVGVMASKNGKPSLSDERRHA